MQGPVRLAACLVLVATTAGCTHHGLLGMQPGQTVAKARAAFHPEAGKGTWKTGPGGLTTYAAPGGVPSGAVLWTGSGGKVEGVAVSFTNDALRHAGKNPVTFRYDRSQVPSGAVGPFVANQTKVWTKGGTVYVVRNAGPVLQVGRFREAFLGVVPGQCDKTGRLAAGLAGATFKGPLGRVQALSSAREGHKALLTVAAAALACPKRSDVRVGAGNVLLDLRDLNDARAQYRAALKRASGWGTTTPADAHGGLALVDLGFGHLGAAVPEAAKALGGKVAARTAWWGARLGDAFYRVEHWGEAVRCYRAHFQAAGTPPAGDPDHEVKTYARLVRATLETVHGCKPAGDAVTAGEALTAGDKARAALLASKAFYLLACKPKEKKEAYRVLGQAVKLDPLHAADWAEVTGYYDREANDAAVLQIMVKQGWLDARGVRAAKEYQKMERAKVR